MFGNFYYQFTKIDYILADGRDVCAQKLPPNLTTAEFILNKIS
jgi:hypothetical protein